MQVMNEVKRSSVLGIIDVIVYICCRIQTTRGINGGLVTSVKPGPKIASLPEL
jgi:hypothetical protein